MKNFWNLMFFRYYHSFFSVLLSFGSDFFLFRPFRLVDRSNKKKWFWCFIYNGKKKFFVSFFLSPFLSVRLCTNFSLIIFSPLKFWLTIYIVGLFSPLACTVCFYFLYWTKKNEPILLLLLLLLFESRSKGERWWQWL